MDHQNQVKPKMMKKKNDMIDSFIEGDMKLDDVLNRMNEEKKHSRGVNNALLNNKRISEMFSRGKKQEGDEDVKKQNPSKSAFFTLNDFLNDLDEDNDQDSESKDERRGDNLH